MDNVTLKKKLSSYVTDKGYLKNVPDEILFELLTAWENWTATAKEFNISLGFTKGQIGPLIGRAKRLKREGYFGNEEFKQLKISADSSGNSELINSTSHGVAEIVLPDGKLIRFAQVDFLLDYLKKST